MVAAPLCKAEPFRRPLTLAYRSDLTGDFCTRRNERESTWEEERSLCSAKIQSMHWGHSSVVEASVRSCFLINPVFLGVTHSTSTGNLARWSRPVERTGTRTVAECLRAVAPLARIPLIDDHLHRHPASPHARSALLLVGSRRQSPVTAFAVDRKRRWNTAPRGRRRFFPNLTCGGLQIADLVELNGLKTRIGNRERFARHIVTDLELVFGVSAFSHADEKLPSLASDAAPHPKRVTQIRVAALVERAAQSNPRLHGGQHTVP